MARRDPVPRDTKDRILQAALEVFEERGYHAASIELIAAKAGTTKGAVYYYFADKQDLARDLHSRILERLKTEAMNFFEPSADTVTNLNNALAGFLAALLGLRAARFFLRDTWTIPELDTAVKSERESSLPMLKAMLDEGVARSEIVSFDTDAMARAIVGAYSEAALHIVTTGQIEPMRSVVEHMVRSFAAPKVDSKPRARKVAAR